jgi:hypothetical protein
MVPLLRRLSGVARQRIARGQALQIAKDECVRQGWPWHEPVHVQEGLILWHFMTNANYSGSNVPGSV